VVGLWGAQLPRVAIPRARPYPYSTAFHGWGPRPFGRVSQLCASACLGGGLGQRSSGPLRCSGTGVPSYSAGRGSLGGGLPLIYTADPLMGPPIVTECSIAPAVRIAALSLHCNLEAHPCISSALPSWRVQSTVTASIAARSGTRGCLSAATTSASTCPQMCISLSATPSRPRLLPPHAMIPRGHDTQGS
jgi:hypothetical protein